MIVMEDEKMIAEILKHLDSETEKGVGRMSITWDEGSEKNKEISYKCCNAYGRPANETIGLLDMYTDLNAGKPDNE